MQYDSSLIEPLVESDKVYYSRDNTQLWVSYLTFVA